MKIILKITGNDKPMALDDIKKITAVKNSDGSRFVVSTPSVASLRQTILTSSPVRELLSFQAVKLITLY